MLPTLKEVTMAQWVSGFYPRVPTHFFCKPQFDSVATCSIIIPVFQLLLLFYFIFIFALLFYIYIFNTSSLYVICCTWCLSFAMLDLCLGQILSVSLIRNSSAAKTKMKLFLCMLESKSLNSRTYGVAVEEWRLAGKQLWGQRNVFYLQSLWKNLDRVIYENKPQRYIIFCTVKALSFVYHLWKFQSLLCCTVWNTDIKFQPFPK